VRENLLARQRHRPTMSGGVHCLLDQVAAGVLTKFRIH